MTPIDRPSTPMAVPSWDGPVRGKEHVVHFDVVAACAAHADRIPIIGKALELPARVPLRDNDVETITDREFTLEGRGRNIAWLCPLSLTERLLRLLAPKLRMAVSRQSFRRRTLRDNDVETITDREFTLEGRGRNIAWLCPLSLTERLLRLLAPKLRKAAGRRLFRRQTPSRRNSSCARVAARLPPRRNCASLTKQIVRQAFLEGSGRSCAVRALFVGPDRLAAPTRRRLL